jgi:AcrR family transcriptional regulator
MAEQGTADPGSSAKTTTKATLIDVGTRLILEQGYHQTGIQESMEKLGIRPPQATLRPLCRDTSA